MALRFELSGVLDDAIYILMGSVMSIWTQIAKNGQQRRDWELRAFLREAQTLFYPRVDLGGRKRVSPLRNTVH